MVFGTRVLKYWVLGPSGLEFGAKLRFVLPLQDAQRADHCCPGLVFSKVLGVSVLKRRKSYSALERSLDTIQDSMATNISMHKHNHT